MITSGSDCAVSEEQASVGGVFKVSIGIAPSGGKGFFNEFVQGGYIHLEDVQKSLETSQGRERKQQHEYDETVAAIPETEAELERIRPLAEAAKDEVKALKDERKKLRQEKKELEAGSDSSGSEEVSEHE